jgi:hypothetical protein
MKTINRTYTGINIQHPISQMILSGEKTIETRKYPIPKHLKNLDLVIIETPGPSGKFEARMIGFVKFGESFEYKNRNDFYKDTKKHCVTPDSIWKWKKNDKKYGWPIIEVCPFGHAIPAPKKKGIKYTKNIRIS